MTTDTRLHALNTKQLWYLATVCGFTLGIAIGTVFMAYFKPSTPWLERWLEIFFWALPAAGAGLGMSIGQWLFIRHIYKNAFLWVLVTTVGVIASVGGISLLILIAIIGYGTVSDFFRYLANWFIHWVKPVTIIAPVAIIIGPLFQWLIVWHVTKHPSFKELLKLSIGWILGIVSLVIMFIGTGALIQSHNNIVKLFAAVVATIPSGFIFAYSTMGIMRNPHYESRSL